MHGSAAIIDEPHPGVLASLWKYRGTSAAIVSVMVLLSVGVGFLAQPRAQAKATIALSSPPAKSVLAPGVQGDASLARYTAQRAAYVTSDAVLRSVAASLRRDDITKLRGDISATPSTSSNTIVIVAEADTDREAVQLAAATIAAYRSETAQEVQRLTDAAITSIEASSLRVQAGTGATSGKSIPTTVSQLSVEASEIRVSSALFGDGVDFVAAPRADAVTRPSIPLREGALGLVLGLLLAATVAWIRADRTRAPEIAPREYSTLRVTAEKSIALYPAAPSRSWPERTR
jgi:succinoglycan biosynthesis transport protein ExoP